MERGQSVWLCLGTRGLDVSGQGADVPGLHLGSGSSRGNHPPCAHRGFLLCLGNSFIRGWICFCLRASSASQGVELEAWHGVSSRNASSERSAPARLVTQGCPGCSSPGVEDPAWEYLQHWSFPRFCWCYGRVQGARVRPQDTTPPSTVPAPLRGLVPVTSELVASADSSPALPEQGVSTRVITRQRISVPLTKAVCGAKVGTNHQKSK